jgi:hypothetical protein
MRMLDMVTIRRKAMVEVAESVRDTSKNRGCGINMATGIFPLWYLSPT